VSVKKTGIFIVISAPSGAGKLTLLNKLREMNVSVATTISATTRAPRDGEVDGVDYYFLSHEEFEQRRSANAFVEWAEVHGRYYGTLRSELDRCLDSGQDVLLELDVQGMRNLRKMGVPIVSLFIAPPDMKELERRLRSRGTENEDLISLRLKNAQGEMAASVEFDYVVVNDDVERAATEIKRIIGHERSLKSNEKEC
jgi:guanylate kinase